MPQRSSATSSIAITPPQLIFFCELAHEPLQALFAQPDVIPTLTAQGYGVALALLDLSDERAAVVQQLNAQRIPVVAWLLLPPEAGYWFNLQNYPHALAAYGAFRRWAARHRLHFAGVGLDIEPALGDMQAAQNQGVRALLRRLWTARSNALFPAAQAAYADLVVNMRHDGYTVYAYQLPFIVDDRRAGTTLIQRMFNIVDLQVDEEVLMCYSSLLPQDMLNGDLNGAFVSSYGIHADGLAVGSTGGGVVLDPVTGTQAHCLTWDAFHRDLLIAARYAPTVHIFSLEGCVDQGWLARIGEIDWQQAVRVPWRDRAGIAGMRALLALTLWSSRLGLTVVGWLGWVVVGWIIVKYWLPGWLTRWRARGDDHAA